MIIRSISVVKCANECVFNGAKMLKQRKKCYKLFISHLLQSKNEQTLLYIGVKPCAKGSIYVALEWGYLYLTFFNISNNLFDFLTSNNLGVESEAGFGM